MSFFVAIVVVGLAGFLSLSYEILWFRVFSFTAESLPTVFGVLLGTYLLGLALGALASRRFVVDPRERGADAQIRAVVLALGASALAGYLVVPGLAWLAALGLWPLGFGLVAVAAALFGLVLPVVSHLGIAPDEAVGARLSYLYLSNIVGSALGSLLTGFVLADVWSTEAIARALALAGVALAGTVAVAVGRRPARAALLAVSVAAAVIATERPLFARLYERLLYKRQASARAAFAQRVETRGGVIAVTADAEVYSGGAYDGFISTDLVHDRNLLVRAYALAAIHPRPARVLVIGVAGGAWTQVVANLPGVERLTAVEINGGFLPIIARHPEVRGLLTDPRIDIVIDDGRRWMARHPDERFDLIVMNTTWHWRAHATNLLSREFLELARRHLRPGGLVYFNTTWSPDAMKTATTVFPHALRVLNFMAASDAPILFDGARWERTVRGLRDRSGRPAFDQADEFAGARLDSLIMLPASLDQPPRWYGLERRESLLRNVAYARVITDDNMVPEWRRTLPLYPTASK
jgi:spermidine synthase